MESLVILHARLVLTIVLAPFLATAFAIVQAWERAVSWRDLALLVGLYIPISRICNRNLNPSDLNTTD